MYIFAMLEDEWKTRLTIFTMIFVKSFFLFLSVLFSALYIDMKVSSIVKLLALREEEDKKSTKTILVTMLLAAVCIAVTSVL